MKTKKQIVKDWLPRYTGVPLEKFGAFILLTNFQKYVDEFAKINNVPVDGDNKNMPSSTFENITHSSFPKDKIQNLETYKAWSHTD